eukprot:m.71716 g.71716  ORF g.71716 m.71716 type:complete len:577 (+) comp11715_c0_seq5:970-2700(+)
MFVVTERLLGYISLETVKKQEQQSGSQDTFKYEGTKLTAWLFETYGIKPLHVLQSIVCKHGAGIQSSLQSLSLHPLKAWTSNQSPPWVVDVRDNVECDVDDKTVVSSSSMLKCGRRDFSMDSLEDFVNTMEHFYLQTQFPQSVLDEEKTRRHIRVKEMQRSWPQSLCVFPVFKEDILPLNTEFKRRARVSTEAKFHQRDFPLELGYNRPCSLSQKDFSVSEKGGGIKSVPLMTPVKEIQATDVVFLTISNDVEFKYLRQFVDALGALEACVDIVVFTTKQLHGSVSTMSTLAIHSELVDETEIKDPIQMLVVQSQFISFLKRKRGESRPWRGVRSYRRVFSTRPTVLLQMNPFRLLPCILSGEGVGQKCDVTAHPQHHGVVIASATRGEGQGESGSSFGINPWFWVAHTSAFHLVAASLNETKHDTQFTGCEPLAIISKALLEGIVGRHVEVEILGGIVVDGRTWHRSDRWWHVHMIPQQREGHRRAFFNILPVESTAVLKGAEVEFGEYHYVVSKRETNQLVAFVTNANAFMQGTLRFMSLSFFRGASLVINPRRMKHIVADQFIAQNNTTKEAK